ncbi:SDR family oxidoreductase [Nocardia vinacea]|uniref:SDR family oxidoreductase n=1 Tax=Nocardia vinacea TaxID=96468 RepID=A0ABZ1Z347_9NOCA|nr:SDR family oxidoreductase [Nocardia vinacea]
MSLFTQYPEIRIPGARVAITGGAQGIGRATAELFAARGAKVAIGDLDGKLAERVAADIGARARAFTLDVASRDSFRAFISDVEAELGPIDVLVNNAGIMPLGSFLEEPDKATAAQINVNFLGPINGMRAVLPGMIGRGHGHVVNVASLAGKMPTPAAAVYSGTKHAVVGLSASVRDEVAEYGVSVSTILPSLVRTELGAGLAMPRAVSVDPADIATAILDTVRTRRAETVIPRWLGAAVNTANLLPARLLEAGRKLAGAGNLGLEANKSADRADYLRRIATQVGDA